MSGGLRPGKQEWVEAQGSLEPLIPGETLMPERAFEVIKGRIGHKKPAHPGQCQAPRHVVLDLFAFWGGAKIRVPEDWTISLQGIPILGGFEDKTHTSVAESNKRLIVRGYAIMGGVEIKN